MAARIVILVGRIGPPTTGELRDLPESVSYSDNQVVGVPLPPEVKDLKDEHPVSDE